MLNSLNVFLLLWIKLLLCIDVMRYYLLIKKIVEMINNVDGFYIYYIM